MAACNAIAGLTPNAAKPGQLNGRGLSLSPAQREQPTEQPANQPDSAGRKAASFCVAARSQNGAKLGTREANLQQPAGRRVNPNSESAFGLEPERAESKWAARNPELRLTFRRKLGPELGVMRARNR